MCGRSRPRQQVTAGAEPEPAAIAGPGALPAGRASGAGLRGSRARASRPSARRAGPGALRTPGPWSLLGGGSRLACFTTCQPGAVRVRGGDRRSRGARAGGRHRAARAPPGSSGVGCAPAWSVKKGGFEMSTHSPGRGAGGMSARPAGEVGRGGAGRGPVENLVNLGRAGSLPARGRGRPRGGMGRGR